MDKSWVSLAQRQCIVCGCLYATEDILLDKRFRASMEPKTLIGTGMCPEHQKLKDEGYIALIEADEKTHERTGRIAHIRPAVWDKLFNAPIPGGGLVYCEKGVMGMLVGLQQDIGDGEGG